MRMLDTVSRGAGRFWLPVHGHRSRVGCVVNERFDTIGDVTCNADTVYGVARSKRMGAPGRVWTSQEMSSWWMRPIFG